MHPSSHIATVFRVRRVRTFKIYSLSNFQVYNTVTSTNTVESPHSTSPAQNVSVLHLKVCNF